jgi:D-sedoheptulose 7-phosphate isomerase
MGPLCDVCICAPSDETPRIQEMHIAAGHTICCLVEAALA